MFGLGYVLIISSNCDKSVIETKKIGEIQVVAGGFLMSAESAAGRYYASMQQIYCIIMFTVG